MIKGLFTTLFLSFSLVLAKPPDIGAQDAKKKIEQIFSSHVTHKQFTTDLMQRTIQNFIHVLDPTKTYFLESEIAKWVSASPAFLNNIIQDVEHQDFSEFEDLHSLMTSAIKRRNDLEEQVDVNHLPTGVKAEDFKELAWTITSEALKLRLDQITALQLDACQNLEEGTQEQYFARLKKRRLNREQEILGTDQKSRNQQTLVYFLKAFAGALDSHTAYFTPAEARQFMIEIDQRLFGIGAQLRDDLNGLTVIRLLDGGPALQSKALKIGDRIIAVNHEPIVGWEISEAVELIRGKAGTPVTLTVLREHSDQKTAKLEVQIVRREIVLNETRYEVKTEPFGSGVIAHIALHSFYQDPKSSASTDIKKAIQTLKNEHGQGLYGIILDLRGNPGGHLPQAISVTGLFISKGVVVSIKDNRGHIQHLRNIESSKVWNGPLIVLTNRASASASEIVAQTLQDYGRALIVGDDHTFGKGSYQTFTLEGAGQPKINPKGEFKVTRGMYFTVSGKSPQLHGAKADIEVPGLLSALDVGEQFGKYPLENDQIPAKFHDDLTDISPFQRRKIKALYEKDLQPKLTRYQPYLSTIQNNAKMRIENNPNYQNFLKAIKSDEPLADALEHFGQNDLQLEEAFNVMKDLILLLQLKTAPTPSSSYSSAAAA